MGGGASKKKAKEEQTSPPAALVKTDELKLQAAADEVKLQAAADEVNPQAAADELKPQAAADEAKPQAAADEVKPLAAEDVVPAPSTTSVSGAGEVVASIWERVRHVTRTDLNLPMPPPLMPHLSVSLKDVSGHEHLDGTGAKIMEATGVDTWRVQPENPKNKPFEALSSSLTPLPPLPKNGVSAACLRSFRAAHPLFFIDDSSTTDVCFKLVIPLTKQAPLTRPLRELPPCIALLKCSVCRCSRGPLSQPASSTSAQLSS